MKAGISRILEATRRAASDLSADESGSTLAERRQRRQQSIDGAWRHVSDYLGMVDIAVARWQSRAATWGAEQVKRFEQMLTEPLVSRTLTDEELVEMERGAHDMLELRLDEESVYIFGNILLDRVALAVKHTLFGNSARVPFDKHSHLTKRLPSLSSELRVPPSARLLELARTLEDELSQAVRDTIIVHPTAPGEERTIMSRAINIQSGETSLHPGVVYPKNEAESAPRAALPTSQLVDDLLEYVAEVVDWVGANVADDKSSGAS